MEEPKIKRIQKALNFEEKENSLVGKVKRKGSLKENEKIRNLSKKYSFDINNTQKDIDENHYTVLKTMRWYVFSAKPIGSLLWSFANSIYHFEKIELNKVYFFKYILCVGYRWQTDFMKGKGFFFDININPISVIHSILCTIIKYNIDLDCHENKVCFWKWVLAKSIFYTLPNSFNFNINIKFKDSYFAINLAGIMAEIISRIFSQNTGLKREKSKEKTSKLKSAERKSSY